MFLNATSAPLGWETSSVQSTKISTHEEALPVSSLVYGNGPIKIDFDDPKLSGDGGLMLVSAMFERLGVAETAQRWVNVQGDGSANVGPKLETLVATMIAGGSHIDHANRLRAGATSELLRHHTYAPSTLGTWLRCFDKVSVTQLDLLAGELFVRAWNAGLAPWRHGTVVVDFDSTIARVFSSAKEGAAYGYTKELGYHPLVATIADTGEIVACGNRDGNAHTAAGSRRMLSIVVGRLRRAGHLGPIEIRADSGFWSEKLIDRCVHLNVGYSVTVKRTSRMWDLINTIGEDRWEPIVYPAGVAQVAQIFDDKWGRIICRRVRNTRDGALFDTWEHHAFITSNGLPTVEADAYHRAHAIVELNIRDLKAGGLAHIPSADRHANAAWVICAGIAHNIARWATNFDTDGFPIRRRTTLATIRHLFIALAVRVCRPQGKPRISGPLDWPAAEWIQACNSSIAAMPRWSG